MIVQQAFLSPATLISHGAAAHKPVASTVATYRLSKAATHSAFVTAEAAAPSTFLSHVATAVPVQQVAKSVVAWQVPVAHVTDATAFPAAHCVYPPVEPPYASNIVLQAACAPHVTALKARVALSKTTKK